MFDAAHRGTKTLLAANERYRTDATSRGAQHSTIGASRKGTTSMSGTLLTRSSERERLGLARWEGEGGALVIDAVRRLSPRGILLRDTRWTQPRAPAARRTRPA
jgi:hypothetical protein